MECMTLLPSIDTVVRQYLPIILDAAGNFNDADKLRCLKPVSTLDSVVVACKELSSISHEDPVWIFMIEDLTFWTEAAVWAAVRNDSLLFTAHIDRAHAVLRDGLDIIDKERVLN